mgnify:CR=1 FL=1
MKQNTFKVTAICFLLMITACSEPLVVIPGGKLDGQVQPTPELWNQVADTIQVEMRSNDPYSINIWAAGLGPDLYMATSKDGTRWTEFLTADPNVRARVNGTLYKLNVTQVSDPEERASVIAAYVSKYELEADGEWVKDGQIFRLDRR